MLASIRKFASTWPARVLFGVLVGAFGLWGVNRSLVNGANDTAVAHVGGSTVEADELGRALQQRMQQLQQQNGPDFQPSAGLRVQLANQVVQQLVYQKLVDVALTRLHVVAPDAAIRDAVFAVPAFQGPDGKFSRPIMLSVLSRNNLTEQDVIRMFGQDVGRDELIGTATANLAASAPLVKAIYAFAHETRVASAVTVPFAGQEAASPTDAELHRYWANHPDAYATPEYRKVKLIVLSAETLASEMKVSAGDIKRYYDLAHADYHKPQLRSLQIIAAPSEAAATALAAAWQGGAGWSEMQAKAKAAAASAIELAKAKVAELPDPALGKAAFAATAGTVTGPVKGDFNWYVFKVTEVTPAVDVSLAEATPDITKKIEVLKANDAMDDRVTKLEDALSAAGSLDTLPAGLGVAAVEGTMDAHGKTPDGTEAPIPAWPALREAIVKAAFAAKPNEAPQLAQVPADKDHPAGASYAVTVSTITPPSRHSFEQVRNEVVADWTADQRRHAAEQVAAQLLGRLKSGMTLSAAAAAFGMTAHDLPPIPRPFGNATVPAGVPETLVQPLFGLKPEEATMVETQGGFVVAVLKSVTRPEPASDPIGAEQIRAQLTQSLGTDLTDLLVLALQQRTKVTLNPTLIRQVAAR